MTKMCEERYFKQDEYRSAAKLLRQCAEMHRDIVEEDDVDSAFECARRLINATVDSSVLRRLSEELEELPPLDESVAHSILVKRCSGLLHAKFEDVQGEVDGEFMLSDAYERLHGDSIDKVPGNLVRKVEEFLNEVIEKMTEAHAEAFEVSSQQMYALVESRLAKTSNDETGRAQREIPLFHKTFSFDRVSLEHEDDSMVSTMKEHCLDAFKLARRTIGSEFDPETKDSCFDAKDRSIVNERLMIELLRVVIYGCFPIRFEWADSEDLFNDCALFESEVDDLISDPLLRGDLTDEWQEIHSKLEGLFRRAFRLMVERVVDSCVRKFVFDDLWI